MDAVEDGVGTAAGTAGRDQDAGRGQGGAVVRDEGIGNKKLADTGIAEEDAPAATLLCACWKVAQGDVTAPQVPESAPAFDTQTLVAANAVTGMASSGARVAAAIRRDTRRCSMVGLLR